MKLIFADEAWEDYLYWQKQDRKMVERINKLIREIQREPFEGIGKPEPLKHALSGFWSRWDHPVSPVNKNHPLADIDCLFWRTSIVKWLIKFVKPVP